MSWVFLIEGEDFSQDTLQNSFWILSRFLSAHFTLLHYFICSFELEIITRKNIDTVYIYLYTYRSTSLYDCAVFLRSGNLVNWSVACFLNWLVGWLMVSLPFQMVNTGINGQTVMFLVIISKEKQHSTFPSPREAATRMAFHNRKPIPLAWVSI